MAVRLAILIFTKGKDITFIHIKIENKTAISYLLRIGATQNRQLLNINQSN